MARRATKSVVNMPTTNIANMPMKSGSVMMPLSAMGSMIGASDTRKAPTKKPNGKKGRRGK